MYSKAAGGIARAFRREPEGNSEAVTDAAMLTFRERPPRRGSVRSSKCSEAFRSPEGKRH